MEQNIIKNIVEAALFAAGRPMSMNELLRLFSEDERPERSMMRDVVKQLTEEYSDRGIELIEVASGYRVQVRHEMGEWLGRLTDRRPPRYSRALMETLALVAYRQPITRGDIEEVRGVSVSTNIIRTLLERGWVRIVGHRDVPGRPAMFGTTKEFLDYFNLKSLDELPSLSELKDMDHLNAELDFGEPPYDDLEDASDPQLNNDDSDDPSEDGSAQSDESADGSDSSDEQASDEVEQQSGELEVDELADEEELDDDFDDDDINALDDDDFDDAEDQRESHAKAAEADADAADEEEMDERSDSSDKRKSLSA